MTKTSMVLFSETNSAFGAPILQRLLAAEDVELAAVVVREPGHLCDYYLDDPEQVDLAATAATPGSGCCVRERVNAPPVVAELRSLRPDYFVVANYQQILRDKPAGGADGGHRQLSPESACRGTRGWRRSTGWRPTMRPAAGSARSR